MLVFVKYYLYKNFGELNGLTKKSQNQKSLISYDHKPHKT